jgi:hypothetical protein
MLSKFEEGSLVFSRYDSILTPKKLVRATVILVRKAGITVKIRTG